jgi:UDP-N-acetylmuramoyl-tripeptide--D-alanyl-D-alanine ligase
MNWLTSAHLRLATGGQWFAPPPREIEFAGVGTDTRSDLRDRIFFALRGELHDGHGFLEAARGAGAAALVVDRDVNAEIRAGAAVLRVADTRRALADLARAYRRTLTAAKVFAITGSAGKTTTKHLLHEILRTRFAGSCAVKSFNNDVGVPLTILSARPDDRYLVVEAGTNAPGEIAALASIIQPHTGVITSIGRSHLEGLGSVEGVAREKSALLHALPADGLAIVPAPCPALEEFLHDVDARVLRVGTARDADMRLTGRGECEGGWWWLEIDRDRRFNIRLPGEHNALNAMLAIAAAHQLGLCDDEIAEALASASPPDMRMTRANIAGIEFFNDAYNANPDSMIASLAAFAESARDAPRRIVVLGDMLELGRDSASLHAEVGRFIADNRDRMGINGVVLVGTLSTGYLEGLAGAFDREEVLELADASSARAAEALSDFLATGDAVLLKGSRRMGLERFIDAVRALRESLAALAPART